jgi:hypothetical protein
MQPDIDRLAASLARTRFDSTCAILNYDDMVAECNLKLSYLITKGRLDRIPNRHEAFKFIKTVFNNHLKSLVSKHRLTQKRGFNKLDPDDAAAFGACTKNVDLSIDDPDQHVQIQDMAAGLGSADAFIEDHKEYFTKIELIVLKEFAEPNIRTLIYAELDSARGQKVGAEKQEIKVLWKHYADGVGLELQNFKKVVESIGQKIKNIRDMENIQPGEELARNRAITLLEEIFGITVPLSLDKSVARRLLTLAAVDNYEKVEDNVAVQSALNIAGAKVPEKRVGHLVCFGIFYHRNYRSCASCGLNAACKAESANYGLADITIDPRLLGQKQVRIPVLTPNTSMECPINNARDEAVYNYLSSNFTPRAGVGELLFKHPDVAGIFVATDPHSGKLDLRFNKPSQAVQEKLQKVGKDFILPHTTNDQETIKVIKQYSNEAFTAMVAAQTA